jgi:hypothetical protein
VADSLLWSIYYENGTRFTSADGGPGDAPSQGVIAIQQRTGCQHHPLDISKTGEARLYGEDWYWWRDDLQFWCQGERDGLLDAVMNTGARWVKQGRMTSHRKWEELWLWLSNDPDFR